MLGEMQFLPLHLNLRQRENQNLHPMLRPLGGALHLAMLPNNLERWIPLAGAFLEMPDSGGSL